MSHESPTSPARRRSLLKKLMLAFLGTLGLVVLGIEIFSRYADTRVDDPKLDPEGLVAKLSHANLEYGSLKRGREQGGARTEPHPYLGYALMPNYRTPPGAQNQCSHNSLGFRGKETTWEKPAGTFRIVTTGGSSVYGQSESKDEAVWSQRLEDMLQGRGPAQKVEVINVGCSGWSSFEMLINLELRALDLKPDLVIVYEAINDMRCALYRAGGPVTRDNRQWRAVWPVDRPSKLEQVLTSSRTYLVWRRYATDYVEARADLGSYGITNYQWDRVDAYWNPEDGPIPELGFENYRRNLENIVVVCRARGVRVLFVTQAIPNWHFDIMDSADLQRAAFQRIQATQKEVAAVHDVPVFDLAPIVARACDEELQSKVDAACAADPKLVRKAVETEMARVPNRARDLLYFAEVHPNDSGSELIARLIAEYLVASPLLAPR